MDGKVAGTLLLPPFVRNAVACGCHVLARGDQIISCYQGTVRAAKRSWAEQNRELLIRYIRAYVEAMQWCFDIRNRASCFELLATHNGIEGKAAEETLDALTVSLSPFLFISLWNCRFRTLRRTRGRSYPLLDRAA